MAVRPSGNVPALLGTVRSGAESLVSIPALARPGIPLSSVTVSTFTLAALARPGIPLSSVAMSAFTVATLAMPGIPLSSVTMSAFTLAALAMSALAWTTQLPKRAAQGFNFLFVRVVLALGQFESLQHFLHVLERCLQGLDDFVYVLDGLLNRTRLGWAEFSRRDGFRRRPSFGGG